MNLLTMDRHAQQRGILAILAATILWSTSGLFIKMMPMGGFALAGYRSAFAALFFALLFRSSVMRVNRKSLISIFFYSILIICFVLATKLTTAANAIFLQYTSPIYVLLGEAILFKSKLKRIDLITTLVCLGGMALFFVGDLEGGNMLGNLLGLVSGIGMGGFILSQRGNDKRYHEGAIFWGNIVVMLVGIPAMFNVGDITINDTLILLYLGLIQMGAAYALFTFALKRIPAVDASLYAMLEPLLNPVWVILFFGEVPGPWAILGGMIIILILTWRAIKIRSTKSKL